MVNFIVGLIGIIWLILIVFLILVLTNERLYCYFFEHKEWNRWKKYIKDIDKFEYCESYSNTHIFTIPNMDITAYIWSDGDCTIHDGTKCVCCSFDKYHSNKMKKLLMNKIKKE